MTSVEGYSLALSSVESARPEIDVAALVRAYSPLLFRVAHSVLRSRTEAEDVVQDACWSTADRSPRCVTCAFG